MDAARDTAIVYELINMHDPYTFVAKNQEVAALTVACFGSTYGAEAENRDKGLRVPVFIFGGFEEWYQEKFDRPFEEGVRALRGDIRDALESLVIGGFNDRTVYRTAIDAIDDPVKKEQFVQTWKKQHLSSLYDLGDYAKKLIQKIMPE